MVEVYFIVRAYFFILRVNFYVLVLCEHCEYSQYQRTTYCQNLKYPQYRTLKHVKYIELSPSKYMLEVQRVPTVSNPEIPGGLDSIRTTEPRNTTSSRSIRST